MYSLNIVQLSVILFSALFTLLYPLDVEWFKEVFIAATETIQRERGNMVAGLLKEVNVIRNKAAVLTDNRSALHSCRNPVFNEHQSMWRLRSFHPRRCGGGKNSH